MSWQCCLLLLCIKIASADRFVHLFGYDLIGETIQSYSGVTDPKECAANCVNYDPPCTGFQMVWNTDTCNLLGSIRSYKISLDQCQYYIRNDSNVSGYDTTGIDALILSNLYFTHEPCPVGWTPSGMNCKLAATEEVCAEYPSYLITTYAAAGTCTIPIATGTWTCPTASQVGPTVMPDGEYYCYLLLPYPYIAVTTDLSYKPIASACAAQGFTLASIHSDNETSLIKSEAKGITIIGYITTTEITTSAFKWLDGTDNDYINWMPGQPASSPFYFTVMLTTGQWMVISNIPEMQTVSRMACKTEATWTIS